MGSIYVVDTNFFIQAHRIAYPLDVVPSFWQKIKRLAEEGKIVSIDKVKNEIYQNEDELKTWCTDNLPENFFQDTSSILGSYSQVVNWAESKRSHYSQAALSEFLDEGEADAWLVSYALHHQVTIITHEISQPEVKRKIKIQEACTPFNVRFINTIDMLRELG